MNYKGLRPLGSGAYLIHYMSFYCLNKLHIIYTEIYFDKNV